MFAICVLVLVLSVKVYDASCYVDKRMRGVVEVE